MSASTTDRAIAAVAKAAANESAKKKRQWLAWQHDEELVVRHAAKLRAAWRAQWPAPAVLARAWRAHRSIGKDTSSDANAKKATEVALAVAWLGQHFNGDDTVMLDMLVLAVEEALRLGRESALQAVADAGLDTPIGDQALEALQIAANGGRRAILAGTLNRSQAAQTRKLAAVLAADDGSDSMDDFDKKLSKVLGAGTWVDALVANEAWRSINSAANTVYQWAEVPFKEVLTAGDQLVCPACEENESAGPVPAAYEFPQGDPPSHPNCRCAVLAMSAADAGYGGAGAQVDLAGLTYSGDIAELQDAIGD